MFAASVQLSLGGTLLFIIEVPLENSQNNRYIHLRPNLGICATENDSICFVILMLVVTYSHAQSEKEIGRVLQKSVKMVIKDPVRVPGVDLEMAGARALDLASSVNEAVDASLKESLKSDIWNVDNLATTDLMQVHTSTTPVATFLDLTDNTQLKEILVRQFEAFNISDVLDNVGTDPGFYLSSDDSASFLDDTYANMLARLDNTARELFED